MPAATRLKGPHPENRCGAMRVGDLHTRLDRSRNNICRTEDKSFLRDAELHPNNDFLTAVITYHRSGIRRNLYGDPGVDDRSSGPAGMQIDFSEDGARSEIFTAAPNATQDTGRSLDIGAPRVLHRFLVIGHLPPTVY